MAASGDHSLEHSSQIKPIVCSSRYFIALEDDEFHLEDEAYRVILLAFRLLLLDLLGLDLARKEGKRSHEKSMTFQIDSSPQFNRLFLV